MLSFLLTTVSVCLIVVSEAMVLRHLCQICVGPSTEYECTTVSAYAYDECQQYIDGRCEEGGGSCQGG